MVEIVRRAGSNQSKVLAPVMMVVYLLAVVVSVAIVLLHAPHFSYTLDDPYIHLALAQNIAHGHYGINSGETTSPSSSVIWPLLLAPLSRTAVAEWVPLLLNLVFSFGTCMLLGRWLEPRLRGAGFGRFEIAGIAICLVLAANMTGLTMTGMEHSLQIFLVVACVIAIFDGYEGKPIPWPYLAAVVVAPAVRYEDVVFTGAVCAVLLFRRKFGKAILVFSLSLLPLLAMGLFLHAHGLPPFPNSVMAKGGMEASNGDQGGLAHLITLAKVNARQMFLQWQRWDIFLCMVAVVSCCWMLRRRYPMGGMLAVVACAIVMTLVGPYDWYFRYDVAIRFFVLLLAMGMILLATNKPTLLVPAVWVLSLLAAAAFVPPLLGSPGAAIEIARQQYEMHRFVQQLGTENVAVNDLGWVSFDARGKFYILDMEGLANLETLREKNRNTAWMNRVTKEHQVGLVMIYNSWFDDAPKNWIKLGVLHETQQHFSQSISSIGVSFFATSQEAAKRLQPQFDAFRKTLPADTWIDTK